MKQRRYLIFYIIFAFAAVMIGARLVNLQVVNGNYYREKSNARTVRNVEVIAPRGEILDRNGREIVTNRTAYNVYILSNRERTAEQLNMVIHNLLKTVSNTQSSAENVIPVKVEGGRYVFSGEKAKIQQWKEENGFEKSSSASEIIKTLIKKYHIGEGYSKEEIISIAKVRFDMVKRGFSMASPYLFAEDVPIGAISVIKEQAESFPNVSIMTQPVRNYPYGSLGAHMLGRVGMISAEEYEKNKDYGYTINSRIGKDGIEKYLEDYLRGENGSGSVEQSSGGYSMGGNVEKAPVNGRDVSLTIDLDMQLACEEALRETINNISLASGSAEGGRDADAGSMVVIDVNTGDVLAMASYPSYEITSFASDYNSLLENPSKPLFNRALAGVYAPASTFKLLVGAAALEENIITTEEEILDTGKYTFFKDYQPSCWIYKQSGGGTHGYLNVSEAIRDSCNIFFFDVGRRLTIEKINDYAKKFGFGVKSGIELADEEKTGVVASPENRKKNNQVWYPGDVCQTAIGQSDTLVTPLQLANYMATIANGGTRYRPHLIKSVKNRDGSISGEKSPEILDNVKLKKENQEAILRGIRMVVTEGTAQKAFSGCKVSVAAKTGSAQTSSVYTNGVCVAYAPYEEPRIAIACVIEKAGSGANVAQAVRKVVDSYFEESEDNDIKTNSLIR